MPIRRGFWRCCCRSLILRGFIVSGMTRLSSIASRPPAQLAAADLDIVGELEAPFERAAARCRGEDSCALLRLPPACLTRLSWFCWATISISLALNPGTASVMRNRSSASRTMSNAG